MRLNEVQPVRADRQYNLSTNRLLLIEYPSTLPDALHMTPAKFE
jgi:hypothetical protein